MHNAKHPKQCTLSVKLADAFFSSKNALAEVAKKMQVQMFKRSTVLVDKHLDVCQHLLSSTTASPKKTFVKKFKSNRVLCHFPENKPFKHILSINNVK